jgi:hypothetical protein
MTDAQKLVIASLVVIGLVLAYNMLDWTSQFGHDDWTPIVIFYGTYDPLGHIAYWGLYTQHGVTGVILGAVVPLRLFVAAAYMVIRWSLSAGRK